MFTYGSVGAQETEHTIIIGKLPEVLGVPSLFQGSVRLDMNPVAIPWSKLKTIVEKAEAEGKPLEFLGHVRVTFGDVE